MPYNQITPAGTIAPGADPKGPSRKEIRDIIETALNIDDFSFSWSSRNRQPYEGTLDTGSNNVNLYIYAWRISNGGRKTFLQKNASRFLKLSIMWDFTVL